jgi:hypothetical protein
VVESVSTMDRDSHASESADDVDTLITTLFTQEARR